ncbi:DUF6948 domain-containing protein [Flavobacterium sp.]|uniref:DUF6948 domain-containing protein n=1 Tax=Flavobacterium sp. TaxID=239 RepID=UPI003F697DF9
MSSINELFKNSFNDNDRDYYVIRSKNASVFVAQIDEIDHKNRYAKLKNARRIWYWDGAASLSELSREGVSKPENCKFPVPYDFRCKNCGVKGETYSYEWSEEQLCLKCSKDLFERIQSNFILLKLNDPTLFDQLNIKINIKD